MDIVEFFGILLDFWIWLRYVEKFNDGEFIG